MTPEDELSLNELRSGLRTSFDRLAQGCREEKIENPAEYWVNLTASYLNGLRLAFPPKSDPSQRLIPFRTAHVIRTEAFDVASGGLHGGPTIDALLQVWLLTETTNLAFAIPILLRCVPSFGQMPLQEWGEIRDIAAALNSWTPSGRVIMLGVPEPFEVDREYNLTTPVYAMSTAMVCGLREPPRGVAGRSFEYFLDDLVSGWIGDPDLGDPASRQFIQFSGFFSVGHVLRLKVEASPNTRSL